jgi:hypothetical protein
LDNAQIDKGFAVPRDFRSVSGQVQDGKPSGRLGTEKSLAFYYNSFVNGVKLAA